MSGEADRDQPGRSVPGAAQLPVALAEPAPSSDLTTDRIGFVAPNPWAAMPVENFLARQALRLSEFSRLVLQTHVPHGPLAIVVVHACVPVLRLPALRCAACGSCMWPCRLVAWARDWIGRLPDVVEALEHPNHLADGVSTPVAVGDVQVPAVTWDTSSAAREEVT